jgi:hypothetical protein
MLAQLMVGLARMIEVEHEKWGRGTAILRPMSISTRDCSDEAACSPRS